MQWPGARAPPVGMEDALGGSALPNGFPTMQGDPRRLASQAAARATRALHCARAAVSNAPR
eukprot:7484262-Pyramimonas_sp.AAC.2